MEDSPVFLRLNCLPIYSTTDSKCLLEKPSVTEDAAMQHLRRVRRPQGAGGRAAEVPSGVDCPGLDHWWETTYERLLRPTVRESRVVTTRAKHGPAAATSYR